MIMVGTGDDGDEAVEEADGPASGEGGEAVAEGVGVGVDNKETYSSRLRPHSLSVTQ